MQVQTQSFEAWPHTSVKGIEIDTQGLPFRDDLLQDSFPGVVAQQESDESDSHTLHRGANSPSVPLVRLSATHGRSYELATSGQDILGFWQDRYGNDYTSISLKGNNFSNPQIYETPTAPSGYLPYGLQEDDALERVLRAGEVMRKAGISTEWVVRLLEPKQLGWKDEPLTQTEYKQRIIRSTIQAEGLQEGGKKAAAIKDLSFFVTARAMEINDRLWDIRGEESPEAMDARLTKAFRVYNLTHRRDTDFRHLDSESIEDKEYYMSILLPKLCGKTLGTLHRLGLTHKFPHLGNYTMLGGLVDTDSIAGPALGLGDPEITTKDKGQDIAHFLTARANYGHTLLTIQAVGALPTFNSELLHSSEEAFLTAYLQASGMEADSHEFLETALWASVYGEGHFNSGVLGKQLRHTFSTQNAVREYWEVLGQQPFDIALFMDEAKATFTAELDRGLSKAIFEGDYSLASREQSTRDAYDKVLTQLRENVQKMLAEKNGGPDPEKVNALVQALELPNELSDMVMKFVTISSTEEVLNTTQMASVFAQLQSLFQDYHRNLDTKSAYTLDFGSKEDPEVTIFKGAFVSSQVGISRDKLMQAIESMPEHVIVETHPIEGLIDPKMYENNPVMFFTDADAMAFRSELDGDLYELGADTNGGTYIAYLTKPDIDGVKHLIFRSFDHVA